MRTASPLLAAFLCFLLQACTTSTGTYDGGIGSSGAAGLTYADIGMPCICDIVQTAFGYGCARNPTNTCPKSQLTCVITTPDPEFSTGGHPLYEYNLFTRQIAVDAGAGVQAQGECTLAVPFNQRLDVVQGTVPLLLSTGIKVLKRMCQSDVECGREGWVCDAPLLDRDGIDVSNPPRETGLNLKICKPACNEDFPDCLRTTPCTIGRPGCYQSPLLPIGNGFYVGDRNGGRTCNRSTGICDLTLSRTPLAVAGNACASNADCRPQYLCVTDYAWSNFPDGRGFCTFANCDPAQPTSCPDMLTCEPAFEQGMCFSDCRGGTLCDVGSKCAALPGWTKTQCIPCDLEGSCP